MKTLRQEFIDKSTKMVVITELPAGEHKLRKQELEQWVTEGLTTTKKQEFKVMAESNLTWAIVQVPDDIDAREWIETAKQYKMTIHNKRRQNRHMLAQARHMGRRSIRSDVWQQGQLPKKLVMRRSMGT